MGTETAAAVTFLPHVVLLCPSVELLTSSPPGDFITTPRRLDEPSVHHVAVAFYSSITRPQSLSFQIWLVNFHILAWIRAAGVAIVWLVSMGRGDEECYSRPLPLPKNSSNMKYGETMFPHVTVYVGIYYAYIWINLQNVIFFLKAKLSCWWIFKQAQERQSSFKL